MRTSESKGYWQRYDSSAGFGFEVPTRACRTTDRNFKSTALALAGWGDSQRSPSLASGLVKIATAHERNGLAFGLLRKDGALESLRVLNNVVFAREGRRGQSDDNKTGDEEFCFHVRPRFPSVDQYGDVVRAAEAIDDLARLPKSDRGT
jgi:hypothetical protein